MPDSALRAREMLKLPGQTTVPGRCSMRGGISPPIPMRAVELGDTDDAAVLQFYLEHGQARGHSPNIWFDEAWHLKAHPGAAAAVRDGHAELDFDVYCHAGHRFRAPHWLFQEARYRRRYPDLSDEVLAAGGNINGYDHFLKHGSREGRIGHILFDPRVYRACLDADGRVEADAVGGYLHYLPRIWERRTETATSHHFDPIWYLRHYPAVAEAIAAGQWPSALHHYWPATRRPRSIRCRNSPKRIISIATRMSPRRSRRTTGAMATIIS